MMVVKYSLYCLMSALTLISFFGCKEDFRMISGSITENGNNGLGVFDFNPSSGTLTRVSATNAGANPSYFCLSKTRKLIYVINEVSDFRGEKAGGLTTLKYSGSFENMVKAGEMPVPNGGPCFISITPDEKFLLVASYGGGSVAVVKLDERGIPVKLTDTIIYKGMGEKSSHAHMILSDKAGERIYVTDLGLDRIMIYTLDRLSGRLNSLFENGVPLPDGTGPRHFVFSGDGSKMYVLGELGSNVTVFQVDRNNGLISLQTISSLRDGFNGKNYSADIHIGKSGKFLYCSNRGENTIATFRILEDGKLDHVGNVDCGGNWPRNFVLDPLGKFILAGNQKSGNVAIFRIDQKSGIPSKITQTIDLMAPGCLKF